MKCAIYARYSSDMQKPESIEDQIRECKAYAEKIGWQVLEEHIYTDYAITGTDILREGYNRLKTAALQHSFDFILVDDLSRLGRNTAESIGAFSEITFYGVNIVSVADGIDTSKKGAKMPFYFKSVMNEFFLDSLREQVLRGQKGQVERGYSAGGRLYGYSYQEIFDPTGAKDRLGRLKRLGVTIKIDPEQANIVKKIFEMRIKGHGLKSIAKYLNESRVSPPRPDKKGRISLTWCPSSIREILRNEKYIGDWTWNKTKWIKYPGSKKKKKIDRPKEEWVISQRQDLRIISDKLWHSVRSLEKKSTTNKIRSKKGQLTGYYGSTTREKYLFSGLLKCGVCGGSMVAVTSKNRGSYLVCGLHRMRGDMACPNSTRIDRHLVEKTLLSEISEKLLEPKNLRRILEKTNRKLQVVLSGKPQDIAVLDSQRKELEESIDNLLQFIMKGNHSEKVAETLAQKEKELVSVKEKLEKIAEPPCQIAQPIPIGWVRKKVSDLKGLFDQYPEKTYLLRQEIKKGLTDKIVMRPDLCKSDQRTYVAEVNADPLSLWGTTPTVSLIGHSATGSRTPV
jgi:site-specific DNA recombinase